MSNAVLNYAKNNAVTVLKTAVTDTATTFVVSDASVLPTYCPYTLTIEDEVVTVTSATGSSLTVERGQEGTTATAHSANTLCANTLTEDSIYLLQGCYGSDFRLAVYNNGSDYGAMIVPYSGHSIGLFEVGSQCWRKYTIDASVLQSSNPFYTVAGTFATITSHVPYDIFVSWNNVNQRFALNNVVWTDATTRAEALDFSYGPPVRASYPQQRYLGTYAYTYPGLAVWNYYNRLPMAIRVSSDSDANLPADTTVMRKFTRIGFVCGMETFVDIQANINTSNALNSDFEAGVAVDSVTLGSGDLQKGIRAHRWTASSSSNSTLHAAFRGMVPAGCRSLLVVENQNITPNNGRYWGGFIWG